MCHLTGKCRHLTNIIFSFPLYIFPEAGLLNHTVVLFSIFWGNFMLFSLLVTIIYIPKRVHKCPLFSTSSPVPLIPCLLVMTILTGVRCCLRVVWICISLIIRCWASFQVSVGMLFSHSVMSGFLQSHGL